MAHHWPGNIRELENAIERAFIMCSTSHIELVHLPEELTAGDRQTPRTSTMKIARQLLDAQTIRSALERNGYNRLATAKDLGIHKSTLFRKIKQLGIILPKRDGRSGIRRQLQSDDHE